jgi:acyl-CoA thioester hydrolase
MAAPSDVAAEADLDLPPSVVVHRKVEWVDTDAAGHHHHGAVLRWVEAAEAVLLQRRGVTDLFGRIPRVHYEVDYRSRLWFGQEVQVELTVAQVGEKSVRYEFVVRSGEVVAATGNLVIVLAAPDAPTAAPWPDAVREALTRGGPQAAETYA